MRVLCVLVACLALTAGFECPSLAGDKLAKLKRYVVTEDVHDKILGDQKEVWGPKQFLELDPEACVKSSSIKKDDKNIQQTETFRNKGWLDGEFSSNAVQKKVENGVYLVKRKGTEPYGLAFYLYVKDGVIAHYFCKFNDGKEPGKKRWEQSFISYLKVPAKDAKIPLDEKVQKNVDEALAILQSDPELFGEVQQHTHFC